MQKNKVQKRNVTNQNISKAFLFFFKRLQVCVYYVLNLLIPLTVPIVVFLLLVASSSYQEKVTYVLYLISSWLVATFIQSKIFNQPKKTFSSIYFKILRTKQTNRLFQSKAQNKNKIVKIMDNLQDHLIKYSDEELLLQNLYFAGKNINLYNPTFAALITGSFIIMTRIDIDKNSFISELLSVGLFFLPIICMYLIVFIVQALTYRISKSSLSKEIFLKSILLGFPIELPVNFVIVLSSSLIFLIFLLIYTSIVDFLPNKPEINITSILINSSSYLVDWLSELLSTLKLNIISFDLNNSSHSNQLSLASIYFTLAFTGSVVLSLNKKYRNEIEGYKERQVILGENYEEWFKRNETCINFNVVDYFKKDKLNDFYGAISNLREDLVFENSDKLRDFVKGYDYTIKLMVMLYFAGILTIIIPPTYLNEAFLFFILFSVVFAISLYWLFISSGFIKEID